MALPAGGLFFLRVSAAQEEVGPGHTTPKLNSIHLERVPIAQTATTMWLTLRSGSTTFHDRIVDMPAAAATR